MSGHSGYTGEGGDSIMSWSRSPPRPLEEVQFDRLADDAMYIAYQDERTRWGREKMAMEEMVASLGVDLASKNRLIVELKRAVEEEKSNSKRVGKEKVTLEADLALFDQVVQDLELDGKEKARVIQELQVKDAASSNIIRELEVKGDEKTRYMVAIIIVAISVLAVLLSSCGKVCQM